MKASPDTTTATGAQAQATPAPGGHRWLLFVHQLPTTPSNLRVRTWRRLQQLGALPVKQAVYVLPDSPETREDLEWLKTEVIAAGGDAAVFCATNIDTWSDDALVNEFRGSRQEAYGTLAKEIERILSRLGDVRRKSRGRAPAASRQANLFRQRLAAIEASDFFGSAGRDRVLSLLKQLDERGPKRRQRQGATSPSDLDTTSYRGRLWVTRPRPGVDRMSSAWLIRRFIDPDARIGFASDRASIPPDGVAFDMFDVEFSHRGDACTFETLCAVFKIDEPAVRRLAAIVHDLDLKDNKFAAPEAVTVGAAIEGLQLAHADDDVLLAQGMSLFDALYRAFDRAARRSGPRQVAKPAGPRRKARRKAR